MSAISTDDHELILHEVVDTVDAAELTRVATAGFVFFHNVDTDSDMYGLLASRVEVDQQQADEITAAILAESQMTVCPFTRYALVRGARTRREAEAYLPDNYRVVHETTDPDLRPRHDGTAWPMFVIEGKDSHGWTLDGYVIPRYASGIIGAKEIDLSHPIMKEVPA